jgi:Zn-dependent M16 (insulinase) family peptidase
MTRLKSYYTPVGVLQEQLGNVGFYRFLCELIDDFEARAQDLCAKLADIAERIFCDNRCSMSFAGGDECYKRFWDAHPETGRTGDAACNLTAPDPVVRNEAFVIPSNVSYVSAGSAPDDAQSVPQGTWHVAKRVLSYDYLWNEVRVKGGAYGTGFRHSTSGLMQFWSYRDPNVAHTLERYERAADWLGEWSGTDGELDGYIVSVVAAHDAPATSRAIARRQDGEFFSERPEGWRNHIREQKLSVTEEKIRSVAPALAELPARRSLVVFGPREAIEASGIDFKVTTLMDEE